jgi:hypothetical protein
MSATPKTLFPGNDVGGESRNLAYGAVPLCRADCDLIAVHCAAHLKTPGLSFCLIIFLLAIRLFRMCKMICVYDDNGSKKVTRMPHLFYVMQPGALDIGLWEFCHIG